MIEELTQVSQFTPLLVASALVTVMLGTFAVMVKSTAERTVVMKLLMARKWQ